MSFTLICHRAINNNNRAMTFASSASDDAAAAAAVPQYEQIGLYTRVIINIILYDLSYHDLFMFNMTKRHTQKNKYKSNENRNSCCAKQRLIEINKIRKNKQKGV